VRRTGVHAGGNALELSPRPTITLVVGSVSDFRRMLSLCLVPQVLVPLLDYNRGEGGTLLHVHRVLLCTFVASSVSASDLN
jgi:hypothetical protein